jgi:hypothetical protein
MRVHSICAVLLAALAVLGASSRASADAFTDRGDIKNLPQPLKDRLVELNGRPHTYPPLTVFSEAPTPSLLFGYYLLDTKGFEPNIFTTVVPGINDGAVPTAANCANGGLATIGSVRLVVEPKPGLPRDPRDKGAFIDIFTDVSGLFVINNESGWYEGWMIRDVRVPQVCKKLRDDDHACFGGMSQDDADAIAMIGSHHDTPGKIFTTDGNAVRFPSANDEFPSKQSNVVPVQLSMGAWNAVQQSDAHAYWEFNPYTNRVFPSYELASTGGGFDGKTESEGCVSLVPGSGPSGVSNDPAKFGDDPNDPRDPDRVLDTGPDEIDCPAPNDDDHKETRLRFIPSGLANEILLDVYVRIASFEPGTIDLTKRLFDAYAAEVARVDGNNDGVIDAEEADLEDESDGLPNERLFIRATKFHRFAITREIDDGLLAPRFAPSQRAWVMTGTFTRVDPTVEASIPQDADNR